MSVPPPRQKPEQSSSNDVYLLVLGPLDVGLKGIPAGADDVTELAEVAPLGGGGRTDARRLLLLLLLV